MFGNSELVTNDIAASPSAAGGISYWPILLTVLAGISAFAVWAYNTEIEQVTGGEGRVIPSGQIQIVQTLEGGIVSSIEVAEGELVEKDQVLVQIDDTSVSAQLGELDRKRDAFLAERYRLLAEAKLEENVVFPPELEAQNNTATLAERAVFISRKRQLENELEVLENRLAQREFELDELRAQEQKLLQTLEPLEEEVVLTERMVQRKVAPRIDLLRLRGRLAELNGDLAINRAAQPRIRATIKEARNLSETTKFNYTSIANERLAKLGTELAILQETIRAASDRVVRATLRSPVKGIVNTLSINTVGAVIQPGRDVAEIVPVDEGLLIEARIRPQDVAFVKPNEYASVKLTAYDYLTYGDLKGQVIRIGADTVEDTDGAQYYQVIIQTDRNYLGEKDDGLPIIPGMVASVDIKTGKSTVLSYLLKPFLRAGNESLRER